MNATKITAHSNCTHPSTKSARALCRKNRTTVQTITTDYGTFEVRTAHVSEITDKDMIHMTGTDRGETVHFFSPVSTSTFRPTFYSPKTETEYDADHYTISIGGSRKIVPLDQTYVIATDPAAVKAASVAHSRNLIKSLSGK